MNRSMLIVFILFLLAPDWGSAVVTSKSSAPKLIVSEKLICTIPRQVPLDELAATEDCSRVAYPLLTKTGECMVVNGAKGAIYQNVGSIFVSSSSIVTYAVEQNSKTFIFVNDKKLGPYDELGEAPPTFSPDGKHIAFVAQRHGQWFVVVDGMEGKGYENILDWQIAFSPDSKRFTYNAIRGEKQILIIDGNECAECEKLPEPATIDVVFSPDSKRAAWIIGQNGKQAVVVDGVKGHEYARVWDVTFSADNRHVAYLVQNAEGGSSLIVDGTAKASGGYIEHFTLSANGSRFAYRERVAGKNYAIVDGARIECGDVMDDPILFSPDGRHVAFLKGGPNGREMIVDDASKGPGYNLQFALGSKPEVFIRREHQHAQVVFNGKAGKAYDNILERQAPYESGPIFSPDNNHLAYLAVLNKQHHVVVDQTEHAFFGEVDPSRIFFSPDSRHVAYTAKQNGKWRLVVDGIASRPYDDLLPYGNVVFENASTVRALARDGNRLLLLHVKVNTTK
jgi:hypothetical protein